MAEPIVYPSQDGQELELPDVDNLGAVAGLADDRVFAELLKLTPYDGTNVYKAVIPYGYKTALAGAYPGATVQPSGSANGSIVVAPFRGVIGSRNAANASPPGANPAQNYQPDSLANWRDIRSGIFVGSSTALTSTIALAANSSGNPRWDLVYATVAVDANGPSQSRRVKSPSTAAVSVASVPAWLTSPVTVTVLSGTPGSSPALPSIPADSAGNYNIPLAYVWVANGFSSTSTVLTKNIRSYANATSNYMLAPGHGTVEPASGNNDRTGTYATNFGWNAASGVRPGPFMSPDMVGAKQVLVEIDCSSGTSSLWSHPPSSVVDASIDWRNRFVRVLASWGVPGSGVTLATDPTGGSTAQLVPTVGPGPSGPGLILTVPEQFGNTFRNDGLLVAGNPTALLLFGGTNGTIATWASGAKCGLYVDASTGRLMWWGNTTGSPGCAGSIFALWIQASAALPNA